MQEATRGTTIKGIKRDQLLRLEFPFPDEIAQENVVLYLDAVSEKGAVYAADVASQTLPKIIQNVPKTVARIEELVARIEEAQELRRRAVEETDALFKSGMKKLFTFHDHDTHAISHLVTMKGGGTPSKLNPYYWEGTIPWISPKDMKKKEMMDSMDHISEIATKESAAKLLDPGAVLIVVRGMILAKNVPSAVLRVPASINQDMKALIPGKIITAEYLCGALWAFNNQILELVAKSTHDTRKLETSKLLNFRIPVPSPDQQQIVICRLNELQAKIDALNRHQAETAAELDALLPAVLERAFRGEL
jgi:type I restriction enzyme S subunit